MCVLQMFHKYIAFSLFFARGQVATFPSCTAEGTEAPGQESHR